MGTPVRGSRGEGGHFFGTNTPSGHSELEGTPDKEVSSLEYKKYRKKPIVVEAIQWKVDNIQEIIEFMGPDNRPRYMDGFSDSDRIIGIETLEGLIIAKEKDWIIKGAIGEFYPRKPDIFEATYEKVV